jgi:hypothetical protein
MNLRLLALVGNAVVSEQICQQVWVLMFCGPCIVIYLYDKYQQGGPGSSVGIATGYGLDGSGIESRWGRDFPLLFRLAVGLTKPPVQWVPGLSRG